MSQVYDGKRTAATVEKFVPIVRKSFAQYLNDVMNERLKKVTETAPEEAPEARETEPEAEESPSINTTQEELEMFITIRTLLRNTVEPSRISYKDTRSYFGILLDNNVWRWICRLYTGGKTKFVIFHYEGLETEKVALNELTDIYQCQSNLERAAKAQMQENA